MFSEFLVLSMSQLGGKVVNNLSLAWKDGYYRHFSLFQGVVSSIQWT